MTNKKREEVLVKLTKQFSKLKKSQLAEIVALMTLNAMIDGKGRQ